MFKGPPDSTTAGSAVWASGAGRHGQRWHGRAGRQAGRHGQATILNNRAGRHGQSTLLNNNERRL